MNEEELHRIDREMDDPIVRSQIEQWYRESFEDEGDFIDHLRSEAIRQRRTKLSSYSVVTQCTSQRAQA